MKVLLMLLFSLSAFAKLSAVDPHIRLMPPGADATAGFVVFSNDSDKPVEIVSAKADFAKTVELHTHKVEDGVMRMRQVEKMMVPAKGKLVLKPHSDHLMFFGVKKDLKDQEKHSIELKLSNGETQKVDFVVRDLNKGHHHGH